MNPKHPTSVRLSEEALKILARQAKRLGISQGAVMEIAIREMMEKEKRK